MTEQVVESGPITPDAVMSPGNPGDEFAGYEDYWGVSEKEKVYLPDGKQYVVVQPMDEGAKVRFQKMTSRDVVLQQKTGDAKLSVDPAGERHQLIKDSVVDWFMVQRSPDGTWSQQPWSKRGLDKWLEVGNPKAIEKVEEGIRKLNPWLQADMTVKDFDEEIDRLTDLRKAAKEREEGELSSATR